MKYVLFDFRLVNSLNFCAEIFISSYNTSLHQLYFGEKKLRNILFEIPENTLFKNISIAQYNKLFLYAIHMFILYASKTLNHHC